MKEKAAALKQPALQFLWGPVLSGFLIGTSYIPFPPWAVFFCCVPLWLFALNQERLKSLLIGGFFCQFVVTVIGFNWVAYAVRVIDIPLWPQAFILLLIFIVFANLHIPLSLFFWFLSRRELKKIKDPKSRTLCIWLSMPIYFGLCTQYYPMIFDWHFGYTWFYAKWPAAQTAEIWGFQFINTLVLFSNLLFLFVFKSALVQRAKYLVKKILRYSAGVNYILRKQEHKFALAGKELECQKPSSLVSISGISNISLRGGLIALCVWLVFFMTLQVWGGYLKNRLPEPDQKIRVLIVQPNIENKIQEEDQWNDFVLSKILRETAVHLLIQPDLPVDFILWPEGTYPYAINLFQAEQGKDPVQKWVSIFNTPLVISAKGEGLSGDGGYTNSLFTFNKTGRLVQAPYSKTLLIPFGEYTPGRKWFPFVDRFFFKNHRAFERGTGANKVVYLNGLNLGFQICYEGLFDWFTRDMVKQEKVDILVNVSNDAWFGNWQEPWQHLYMTLARAIEVRRPLIRGTNSGFSAVISAKGEISSPRILGENFSGVEEVSFYSSGSEHSSLFVSWGYYINQFFLWICLIFIHLRFFIRL